MTLFNIGGMRKPYNSGVFTEDNLVSKEPFGQFAAWFEEACKTDEILEANAMCIATANKDAIPSARFVLLKGYSKEGFSFYSKYTSRKGEELLENPRVSLCFYWEPLKRSIRINGEVKKVPDIASSEYFDTRPRESQIATHVSCKSPKVIASRDQIIAEVMAAEEEFRGKKISRPNNWGGYIVIPNQIEFWQGQTNRMHDRIIFKREQGNEVDSSLTEKGEDGWFIERWAP